MDKEKQMTEMGIGPILNMSGTMYVDIQGASGVALFEEITANDGPDLALGDIEDVGYIYESPTVVTRTSILIGESAIRDHFGK